MDDDRFDTLSRMLATAPSRRTALRLLAGTALRRGASFRSLFGMPRHMMR